MNIAVYCGSTSGKKESYTIGVLPDVPLILNERLYYDVDEFLKPIKKVKIASI